MVFDHPYFAITKADGNYTIPCVPANAELTIMAWHEQIGSVLTKNGKTLKTKAGNNTFDFTITAR